MGAPAESRTDHAPLEAVTLALPGGASSALYFGAEAAPGVTEAALLCIPAMGVPARFYGRFLAGFAGGKIAAAVCELRGNGRSSVRASRKCDFGYHEIIAWDAAAAAERLASEFPGLPIFLLGHSLGGHIAAIFAGCNPGRCSGLILIASGTPYFRNWPFPGGVWHLARIECAYFLTRLIGFFPGRIFGFGWREAKRLLREWRALAWTGKFAGQGLASEAEGVLAGMSLPVLSLTVEGDTLAPPNAIRHFEGKMRSAQLESVRIPDPGKGARHPHFDWAASPALAATVEEWILAHRPAHPSGSPNREACGKG